MNGWSLLLSLPVEKQKKALHLLNNITGKKKMTVKQIQVLTGYLNFLTKVIFAGRTFTWRMYTKYAQLHEAQNNSGLKSHHHIRIDSEFRFDCEVWRIFLTYYEKSALCHPMVDLSRYMTASQLNFYSDASACARLSFRAVFNNKWIFAQWENGYIDKYHPSIKYLELLGLAAALLTWGEEIRNQQVIVFCDNMAVVNMVNNGVSSCWNCMHLLRLITLNNLINNRRLFTHHVKTAENSLADALSRLSFKHFWHLAPETMSLLPCEILPIIWPASNIWVS